MIGYYTILSYLAETQTAIGCSGRGGDWGSHSDKLLCSSWKPDRLGWAPPTDFNNSHRFGQRLRPRAAPPIPTLGLGQCLQTWAVSPILGSVSNPDFGVSNRLGKPWAFPNGLGSVNPNPNPKSIILEAVSDYNSCFL